MILAALVLLFLWMLTISTGLRLIFPLRAVSRRSPVSFLASLFAALALTMNFPPVYIAMDELLGGRNFASLTQHTFLVLTAYFVMRLLLRSVGKLTQRARVLLNASLAVVLVVQTVSFLLIKPLPTTPDLMAESYTQVAALVFSLSHFLYFGIASAVAAVAAVLILRTQKTRSARVGSLALLLGGGAGVANVIVVALRDTSRLLGNMSLEVLDPLYRVLIVVIALGFCIGLSVPAIAGAARRRRIERTLVTLEGALARSKSTGWKPRRITQDTGAIPVQGDAFHSLNDAVIQLRDGQMFETGPELTPQELKALENAELLLHGR